MKGRSEECTPYYPDRPKTKEGQGGGGAVSMLEQKLKQLHRSVRTNPGPGKSWH